MKKVGIAAVALAISVIFAGYGFNTSYAADKSSKKEKKEAAASDKKDASKNAALVNGKPITMLEYQSGLDQFNRQIAMTGKQPDAKEMPEMKKKVLDNLIGRELLKQEAAKKGIKADEAEVNSQLDTYKNHGTPEAFAASLKQMNMTEAAFKDFISSQFAIKKLIAEDLASKITVPPEEVKSFYDANPNLFQTQETVRASHILVTVEKTATAEEKAKALEKIKQIQKRIQSGEDFATVAKEVSDCPSKSVGGDLNFFQKDQMVAPFANAAFSLKVGETSDIVETEFGYHIIRLTDKKEAGKQSFDEAKPRIEQHLKAEKLNSEILKYVDSLKSKAKIQILVKD